MSKIVNGKIVPETQADLDQAAIDEDLPIKTDATVDEIKQEAGRRIMLLIGVETEVDMIFKEMNAVMRGVALNNALIENGSLTSEEQAEAAALKGLEAAIVAIRTASDTIEQAPPKINQLQTDNRWPAF